MSRVAFTTHRLTDPPLPPHAASDIDISPPTYALPPWRFVVTCAHAGPLCLRPLNQNALDHTLVPAGSEELNAISRAINNCL